MAAALYVAVTAWAVVDQPPTWASLNKAQQATLAPLQRDWASIDAPRKQKWLEVAGRFARMPESERRRVQERMAEWARMTPAQRTNARLQFQETRQLSPADRQARWEAYKALTPEQRQALARRAHPPARSASAADGHHPDSAPKRNTVAGQKPAAPKPISPTVVQAKPGATTTLMTAHIAPPARARAGQPKIAATDGYVNPATLLPRRGPPHAVAGSAASAPARHP